VRERRAYYGQPARVEVVYHSESGVKKRGRVLGKLEKKRLKENRILEDLPWRMREARRKGKRDILLR